MDINLPNGDPIDIEEDYDDWDPYEVSGEPHPEDIELHGDEEPVIWDPNNVENGGFDE